MLTKQPMTQFYLKQLTKSNAWFVELAMKNVLELIAQHTQMEDA